MFPYGHWGTAIFAFHRVEAAVLISHIVIIRILLMVVMAVDTVAMMYNLLGWVYLSRFRKGKERKGKY